MVGWNETVDFHGQSGFRSRLSAHLSAGLRPVSIFFAIYFAISIAARLMLPNSLTLDEAEQSLFSQYWLAGYGPQPPFYNWVQTAIISLIGISLLSLTLPKFTMLLLCYVFYGLAARELKIGPGFVSMSMLCLLTLPQVSYMPQQDLTHTVAVLMATSLFFYGLLRTLSRADWQSYVITGIAIGIGIISKYNFALLPGAAFIAIVCEKEWRTRLFDPRILLTAIVSLAIVLPHALWLLNNLELATAGTLGKMVDAHAPHGLIRILLGIGKFLGACLAFGTLTVLILAAIFRQNPLMVWKAQDRWARLLGRIMLISLSGVLAVVLATGTTKLTERWLDPYLLALPLYLLVKLERTGVDAGSYLRRALPAFLVIMFVTLTPQTGKTVLAGVTGSYTRINYPFAALAEQVAAEDMPALIVAPNRHVAGNMRFQFPDVPVIDSRRPVEGFPAREAMKGPALAVWEDGDEKPEALPAADLSSLIAVGLTASQPRSIELPFYFGDGQTTLKVGYMWLR